MKKLFLITLISWTAINNGMDPVGYERISQELSTMHSIVESMKQTGAEIPTTANTFEEFLEAYRQTEALRNNVSKFNLPTLEAIYAEQKKVDCAIKEINKEEEKALSTIPKSKKIGRYKIQQAMKKRRTYFLEHREKLKELEMATLALME